MSRSKLEELDIIAKRYSVKPSSLINDDIIDYQFNLLVCVTGLTAEKKQNEKETKRIKGQR